MAFAKGHSYLSEKPACPVPECCKEHPSQMVWMGNWRDVSMALLQLH